MANIMIVDDSAIMRRNLKTILLAAGHTVVAEAVHGGQAHLLYRQYQPDLVTMDITMPNVNGIEAVKLIMKDFPDARIVMVSALNQRNMVFEALNLGAKHYILKPINAETVISVINKVLGIEEQGEGVAKSSTTGENQVDEVSEAPFTIENTHNMFHIKITSKFNEEGAKALGQAIQGLLFVQPLKVLLTFGKLQTVDDSLLEKVSEVVRALLGAKGTVKVISQNKTFVQMLKTKHLQGLSDMVEFVE